GRMDFGVDEAEPAIDLCAAERRAIAIESGIRRDVGDIGKDCGILVEYRAVAPESGHMVSRIQLLELRRIKIVLLDQLQRVGFAGPFESDLAGERTGTGKTVELHLVSFSADGIIPHATSSGQTGRNCGRTEEFQASCRVMDCAVHRALRGMQIVGMPCNQVHDLAKAAGEFEKSATRRANGNVHAPRKSMKSWRLPAAAVHARSWHGACSVWFRQIGESTEIRTCAKHSWPRRFVWE